jgi:hypothetical protein
LDFAKLLRFGEGDCDVAALEEFATQKWFALRQLLETRAVWLDRQIELGNGLSHQEDDEIASHLRTIELMTSTNPVSCKITKFTGAMDDEDDSEADVELDDGIEVFVFRGLTMEIAEIHSRFGTRTDNIVNNAFFSACYDDENFAVARVYLALGASLECSGRGNLLNVASAKGKYNVVEFILSTMNIDLETDAPLVFACVTGHIEIVRLLLSDSRIKERLPYFNGSLLGETIRSGHASIVRILLAENVCPFNNDRSKPATRRGREYDSGLYHACMDDQVEIVKMILEIAKPRPGDRKYSLWLDECRHILRHGVSGEIRDILTAALN